MQQHRTILIALICIIIGSACLCGRPQADKSAPITLVPTPNPAFLTQRATDWTATQQANATHTPTPAPTITPNPTATDTQTPAPTATPIPSATQTETPLPTPSPVPPPTNTESAPQPTATMDCICDYDAYNCDDPQAVPCYHECQRRGMGDVHQLDKDQDGLFCEQN